MESTVDERDDPGTRPYVFQRPNPIYETDVLENITQMITFSLGIVYLNDVATNELEAAHVIGSDSQAITGLRIPLGQRLSGWVAVNRQTILNSDASLDLGVVAKTTGLRFCLSTPLTSQEQFVGVITLYSTSPDGFTEADRETLESFAKQTMARRHTYSRRRA